MKKKIMLLLMFYFVLMINTFARDAKITIPLHDGFLDAAKIDESISKSITQFMPPDTNVMKVFIQRSDAERFLANEDPTYSKYFIIATSKSIDAISVKQNEFNYFKKALKLEFDNLTERNSKLLDNLEEKLSESLSEDAPQVDYKFDKIIPLGIDFERDNIISYSLIMNSILTCDGKETLVPLACSVTALFIHDKIVMIYAYNLYKEREDLKWLNNQSMQIAESIIDANPEKSTNFK